MQVHFKFCTLHCLLKIQRNFEQMLYSWQKSMHFVNVTYKAIKTFPGNEIFGLVSLSKQCDQENTNQANLVPLCLYA